MIIQPNDPIHYRQISDREQNVNWKVDQTLAEVEGHDAIHLGGELTLEYRLVIEERN
jgi:hypothetical protein